MSRIAPSAYVDPEARIGADVEVAPGCYVGPKVTLGDGCRLMANSVVLGNTTAGKGNVFYPGCVVGAEPQDLKYRGTDTQLIIGDENKFREFVTVHVGTETGGGVTKIGDHNQFQVSSHIAHDVKVGDHCVLSNHVQIAGHVVIENYVNISGLVGVQQFVTIGSYSFIAGATRCTRDVPPYLIFSGFEGEPASVNEKGLRRWGFAEEHIEELRELFKKLYLRKAGANGGSLAERLETAMNNGHLSEHSRDLLGFIRRSVESGVCGRYLESQRSDVGMPPPGFYGQ